MRDALHRKVVPGIAVLLAAACVGGAVCAEPSPTTGLPEIRLERFDFASAGAPVDFTTFEPHPLEAGSPRFRGGAFYRRHLLPKLTSQFDRLAAYRYLPDSGRELELFVLHDEVTDSAGYRAGRATKKAVRDYLLEKTSLGRVVRAVRGERSAIREDRESGPVDWGVNISHGVPEVSMRYALHGSVVRVGVGASGDVGLEWGHARRMTHARIVVGYDARDSAYDLHCRVSF